MSGLVWTLLWALGCVDSTGGERVTFDAWAAQAVPPADDHTLTWDDGESGWQITLTEATMGAGPIWLWSGEPLVRLTSDSTSGSSSQIQTQVARGKGDDFDYGFLRGEALSQGALDLLDPTTPRVSMGEGHGLAGEAKSAEMWLAEPVSRVSSALHGETLWAAGEARKAAEDGTEVVVPFEGALTINDDTVDEGETAQEQRKVRGMPFTGGEGEAPTISNGGALTLTVDVTAWFAGVDFAALVEESTLSDDGVYAIPVRGVVWSQWYYRARQAGEGPYQLSWEDSNTKE